MEDTRYTVTLHKIDNGWLVSFCDLALAFTDAAELGFALMRFVKHPEEVYEAYRRLYRPDPETPGQDTPGTSTILDDPGL